MWLIVTTGSDDFFQFFQVVVGSCVLRHDTGFSLGVADVGCPHREAPTPCIRIVLSQRKRRQWGLLMLTALPQLGDAVHKLHINRGLEVFLNPLEVRSSHSNSCTNSGTPLPPKLTLTQDESPTQKLESTLNSKSCHEDKFLFRYKCVFA